MPAVLTVDQYRSRTGDDLVPQALGALTRVPTLRAFERTAGDEFQGVLDDAAALPQAVEVLLRSGSWNIGIGLGAVELDQSHSARAGRGPGYLAARDAVTAAKHSPWRLRVSSGDGVPGAVARHLESALWLWAALLARRTDRGWEVVDLVDSGLSYEEAGRRLGITQSAVSQRARAAGLVEGGRARELAEQLTRVALKDDR